MNLKNSVIKMYPGLSDQDCELKVKILHFEVQSQNSEMRVIRVNL